MFLIFSESALKTSNLWKSPKLRCSALISSWPQPGTREFLAMKFAKRKILCEFSLFPENIFTMDKKLNWKWTILTKKLWLQFSVFSKIVFCRQRLERKKNTADFIQIQRRLDVSIKKYCDGSWCTTYRRSFSSTADMRPNNFEKFDVQSCYLNMLNITWPGRNWRGVSQAMQFVREGTLINCGHSCRWNKHRKSDVALTTCVHVTEKHQLLMAKKQKL